MCTGAEIAAVVSLAASAAGTGVSIAGQQQAQSQMNAAANAELQRQAQFQQQASKVALASQGGSTPQVAQQQIDTGTAKALQQIANVQSQPLSSATAATPLDKQVQSQQTARTGLTNQAQAGNLGYNEYTLQQGIKNLLANQQLGLIGSTAGQSAGVLPYELQQAQQSGAGLQGLGSLLQTGGYLGGLYGAVNSRSLGQPGYVQAYPYGAPKAVPVQSGYGGYSSL